MTNHDKHKWLVSTPTSWGTTLPEIEIVANYLNKDLNKIVDRSFDKRVRKDFIENYVLSDMVRDLEQPKPLKVNVQPEDEWRPIQMYDGGKSRDEIFARNLGPLISAGLRKRGYDSYITYDNVMRQLAHESGAGTSNIARNQHNYGGFGHRVEKGKDVYSTFDSDQHYVDTYLDKMVKDYSDALKAKDIRSFARALKKGGYYEATEEKYAKALSDWQKFSRIASSYYPLMNKKQWLKKKEEPWDPSAPMIVVPGLKKPGKPQEVPAIMKSGQTAQLVEGVPYRPKYASDAMENFRRSVTGYTIGKDGMPTINLPEVQVTATYDPDLKRKNMQAAIEDGLGYLPYIGTAIDIKHAIEDPSLKNISFAGLGLLGDITGLGLLAKGIKAVRRSDKAIKAARTLHSKIRAARVKNKARSGIAYQTGQEIGRDAMINWVQQHGFQ